MFVVLVFGLGISRAKLTTFPIVQWVRTKQEGGWADVLSPKGVCSAYLCKVLQNYLDILKGEKLLHIAAKEESCLPAFGEEKSPIL